MTVAVAQKIVNERETGSSYQYSQSCDIERRLGSNTIRVIKSGSRCQNNSSVPTLRIRRRMLVMPTTQVNSGITHPEEQIRC